MAYEFPDDANWAAEIAEETTKSEYQSAQIRIVDPSLKTKSYDVVTGEWTITGEGTLYTGQARLIPVRWGLEAGGESQANATTLSAIRIQVPGITVGVSLFGSDVFFGESSPFGGGGSGSGNTFRRVRKGSKVFVDSCPLNPTLEDLIFTVTSDIQGSTPASRTFQAMLDGDVRKP